MPEAEENPQQRMKGERAQESSWLPKSCFDVEISVKAH